MNLPAHNVMHALRRFVGLRSAWRRSLAMEPRESMEPVQELDAPRPKLDGPEKPCGCHA